MMIDHQNQLSCFIIGEGTLPIQCAELLLNRGYTIYGIISSDTSISNWGKDKGIPYIKPTDNLIKILSQQPFDYLFSIVNNFVLPQEILDLPRQCAINYHDAPLPRYAGVNATSWALMHQEKTHGITWHIMAVLVDAGDILKQVTIDIADDETAWTLNGKCYEAAIHAFDRLIEELLLGTAITTKQDLSKRTYFSRSKRLSRGGIISWQSSAHQLDALIRALDFGSYPNRLGRAKLIVDSNLFVVSKLEVLDKLSEYSPGTITAIEPNYLIVSTASYDIALHQVLAINGQPLSISALVEKFGLKAGYQFCDIEVDQARQIEKFEKSIANHEAFWVKRLASLELLVLPYEKRPVVYLDNKSYASAKLSVPYEAIAFLEERRPEWNWDDFLETAFVAYLARISGTGCFDMGLKDTDLQQKLVGLQGLFASVIPCRVDIDCEQSFEEVFEAFKKQVAFTKLHLTYAQDVVSRHPSLRSLSELVSQQLFPVILERMEKLEDYQAEPANKFSFITRLDKKECYWFYNTEVFDGNDIARMQEQFSVFLQGIITEPNQRITYLPLLSEQEQYKILVEWNNTQVDYPQDKCIHQLFEEQVQKTPLAVAVVFENQQLTYLQLNQRANQLAHHLQTLGVGPDVLVGICVERSIEMVVGLLGILKAGGAYVPLDPNYPAERLSYMLADSGVEVLLTHSELKSSLPSQTARVVCLDTDWRAIEQQCGDNLNAGVKSDNLAYAIYTSGSTGQPKGVMIPHHAICNHMFWMQTTFPLTEADKVLQKTPFSFDASIWEFYAPLLVGAQLLVARPRGHQDSAYLIKVIAEQKVTTLQVVPSLLQMLLDLGGIETCNSLSRVFCGGEALPVALQERFFAHLDADLHNLYGPTEACIDATYWTCKRGSGSCQQIIPIGRPIANTQIYILDKHHQPVPIGVPGELYIGGDGLALGYLNRPSATSEKFIPNPFNPDQSPRLYRTGDLGSYLPDGHIEFLGRIDNQVKIRGFRIELGEIEAVLNAHPQIQQAVVIALEDIPGNKRLVAYVVPRDESLTTKQLREFLKEKLPEYMVPSAFVTLDTVPLTPNGKIDKKALPAPDSVFPEQEYQAPRTPTEEIIANIFGAVLGVQNIGIHDNFFELGGHSLLATQVISRLREDFSLELSLQHLFKAPTIASLAQSIEALRGVNQDLYVSSEALKKEYDKETLIPQLQEGKAEILTFEAGTYQEPWWGKDNEYPLSPELELYWVASQLTSGDTFAPTFSIPNRSIWECEFDPVLFQRACDLVVERNQILRTRLIRKGAWFLQILSKLLPSSSKNKGSLSKFKRLEQATIALLEKPNSVQARLLHRLISLKIQLSVAVVRQKVLPPQSVSWTYHNYEYVSDEMELQSIVEEIVTKEGKSPFDMETGPLLRCTVIKHSRNIHTVIAIAHHGFVDFIGIQQVSDELRAVYQALLRNELDSLAVRPQYSDYATRWASLRNSTSYRSDIEFWQKHFAQCQPMVVPPRPSTYHREDFSISEPVAKETAALIHSYCQQIRVPASAFFLAGYYLFLYQITGQSHLYTVVNNGTRPDLESEATIGTFLQLFPLVVNLTETPTIADVIQASAQNIFAGLDHRKVSLPRLVSHDIRIAAAMMKQPACVFQIIHINQQFIPHRRLPHYAVAASDWNFSIGINGSAQYNINVNYNTAFYGHEYVENLCEEYHQILAIMATNPLGSVLDNLTPFAT